MKTERNEPLSVYGPQIYLCSASIVLSELLKLSEKKLPLNYNESISIFTKYLEVSHESNQLIYSVIFNIKHGIELWLKIIQKTLSGKDHFIEGDFLDSHDLLENFKEIQPNLIFKIDIKKIIDKYSDLNNILTYKGPSNDLVQKIKGKEYIRILKKNSKIQKERDNIFGRYPELSEKKTPIGYYTFNIQDLKNDCIEINKIFRKEWKYHMKNKKPI